MFILGVTGSIGMGKTTVAGMLRDLGAPVFDSDAAVHELYAGEAAALIEAAFPGAAREGSVDRAALRARLIADPSGVARLEAIVHPLVRRAQWTFLKAARASGAPLAALDIPLLYETGADALMDAVMVVSAPPDVQRARVLARPGMTEEAFGALLARQTPDAEKRARADIVVDTGVSLEATRTQIRQVLAQFQARPSSAYARWMAAYGEG
ncbi:MAG: dephospho-CoA kinase [Hyphomicrobiales bacterium]|nr:dephospho-CoA kinase [Hyphomicrobiales bacterium]